MATAKVKNTYTAAEVAVLESKLQQQQKENDALKKKLEHMNEFFANALHARFGQSSKKKPHVLGENQICLFNEAELLQDHKTAEPSEENFTVKTHTRKKSAPLTNR